MRRRTQPASPVKLIRQALRCRTVFIRKSDSDRVPQELWDIICTGSDVVLIVDAPDEGFSVYGDHVVSWSDPDVTIDGVIYVWPDNAKDVHQLFEP